MPLHDMEGALVGIVADAASGYGVPVASAVARTIHRASSGERLGGIGLSFQPISSSLQSLFGQEGVLISDLIDRGPADEAGVKVGDVLLDIDSQKVDSPEAAVAAVRRLRPGSTTALRVNRRGRAIDLTVVAATAYDVAALARKRPADRSGLSVASTLFDQSTLDALGIPGAARVLSVNWKRLSLKAQVDRERRATRGPLPVHLLIGDAAEIVTLEPVR
jgi:hypothetical protein